MKKHKKNKQLYMRKKKKPYKYMYDYKKTHIIIIL